MCGGTNVKPVCAVYYELVFVSTRCPCWPPLRFDATDAALPLTNRFKLIIPSLIGYHQILRIMGVGKSTRTPSMLLVAPTIISCTLGDIKGGFVPWENSPNLLKS